MNTLLSMVLDFLLLEVIIKLLRKSIYSIFFFFLKLRYSITVSWLEKIHKGKSYLFLPNHQALFDPLITGALIGKENQFSPVVSETYYNLPLLKLFFKLVWAVSVWDLQRGTGDKDKVKNTFHSIIEKLKEEKNVLLYPAGQLYSQGFEVVRWKQTAFNVVQLMPDDTQIIWIRLTWLWWSVASKAYNWTTPNFFVVFIKWMFFLLANLVFFSPRRKINIEIVNLTRELKSQKKLNDFNKKLEEFYNVQGEESIKYISHFFYFNDVKDKVEPAIIKGSLKEIWSSQEMKVEIPENVQREIVQKISEIKWIDREKIQLNSNLIIDLYFDSLDLAELKAATQVLFKWGSNPPITDLKTVYDICVMAMWKSTTREALKACEWQEIEHGRKIFNIINSHVDELGERASILSLFKKVFSIQSNNDFAFDNILWLQSKKDFLIKAYLIKDIISTFNGKNIWIMLPSLTSSSLLITSSYLADKVPVMLNWTLGETQLLHCINFAQIDHILTSRKFYEKIKNNWTEQVKDKYVFIEDLLKDISLISKIKALIKSKLFFIPKQSIHKTAVLLFTSWSESLPKAVKLTHKNIIYDILGSVQNFSITTKDILVWFLPPFHSFGFTVNTIMPLISGLRVAYTPDPNDSSTITQIIRHCHITSLTATPTFLKMILSVSSPADLKSLKYAVVGAEKCSDELFEKFEKLCPQWNILEWYWITECSPVISINPPSKSKRWSVGPAIGWLKIKIIDLNTHREVQAKEQWMIYVKWENVFDGYLDESLESPFDIFESDTYYKTWDLWYKDEEGYLYITWRLKRFIKIAWEMVSLPFIESILSQKYWTDDELKIAVEAKEENLQTKISLFSTYAIDLEEANNYLRQKGVSNLIKISEVIILNTIPVLWTGKTDYKSLKDMISFSNKRTSFDFADIEGTIIQKIEEIGNKKWVHKDMIFGQDVILDSIDIGELMIFIKTNFHTYKEVPLTEIKSVQDIIDCIK